MLYFQARELSEMQEILEYLEVAEDKRQAWKVQHKLKDIIAIVFFATLANANDWMEIYYFAMSNEAFLRKYLELPNGIPSHDTLQRVYAMVAPEYLESFQEAWNKKLSSGEGEKLKKILAIDGKTQRGNGNRNQKGNHIVSAVDENGFCLGQRRVDEKSNEITAIPALLEQLNIKGQIITIDAMGTQVEIMALIKQQRADYVLALKRNQEKLYEDVRLYFDDMDLLSKCAYQKTVEKARGCIEKREYWHTDDISWLTKQGKYKGLRSIAMTRNTITKDGITKQETRYYVSSLPLDVKQIARAIRGHWMIESFHWHLDVTFREDANRTLEKNAAYNLNIIRKIALTILKLYDIGHKGVSLKGKRFIISMNAAKHLEALMNL